MRGDPGARGTTFSGQPLHYPRMNTNLAQQGARFSAINPMQFNPVQQMTPVQNMPPPYMHPVATNYSANPNSNVATYQQQQQQQQQLLVYPTNSNAYQQNTSAGPAYLNVTSVNPPPLHVATVGNTPTSGYTYRRRVIGRQPVSKKAKSLKPISRVEGGGGGGGGGGDGGDGGGGGGGGGDTVNVAVEKAVPADKRIIKGRCHLYSINRFVHLFNRTNSSLLNVYYLFLFYLFILTN